MKPSDPSQVPPLTADQVELIEGVLGKLTARTRERTSREEIEQVVRALVIDETRPAVQAPVLQVARLRFSGQKLLNGQPPEPFTYDQTFASGVNVICVPDNDVGKSTILKTIKFALTCDDDYDNDVKSWISDIWLTFRLNQQLFTVMHTLQDGHRAALVAQEEGRPFQVVIDEGVTLFEGEGSEEVREALQQFFFRRLGLEKLSWAHSDARTPAPVERSISWRTYFQALYIPDNADEYLLVDDKHATGNQGGLILSALLGLSFTRPLNRLGVEMSLARKELTVAQQTGAASVTAAQAEMAELSDQMTEVRRALKALSDIQAQRRMALLDPAAGTRLPQVLAQQAAEQRLIHDLEEERQSIGRDLRAQRARLKRLDEAIALRLHFTGLEVELCPSCDHDVDAEAIARERETHTCRLCGKPAQQVDSDEIEEFRREADLITQNIRDYEQGRRELATRLDDRRQAEARLTAEVKRLQQVASQSLDDVLPTPDEQAQAEEFYIQLGQLTAAFNDAKRRSDPPKDREVALDRAAFTRGRVREYLQAEAETRNQSLLTQLSQLTQDAARTIGAESFSDVSCSALGTVSLKKHGEPVKFTTIRNQGERLRIKLAFFLAMMRLGRQTNAGRHPGFLIIDQPGSGEMVAEDFLALAGIFQALDQSSGGELQIITATARPEFAAATAPEKVYGPTAGGRAF